MDIIETEGIKIPNSIIVSGLTETESDDELFNALKKNTGQLSKPYASMTKNPSFLCGLTETESDDELFNALKKNTGQLSKPYASMTKNPSFTET